MGKSICCQSETHLGYYNPANRPDLHGIMAQLEKNAFCIPCACCDKCGKSCDYIENGIEYYTNGIKK